MIKFLYPTNLIVNGVLIIANIFYVSDYIYLISPSPLTYNMNDIKIMIDGIIVAYQKILNNNYKKTHESVQIIRINFNGKINEPIKITILYMDEEYHMTLNENFFVKNEKIDKICAHTLFKSDYDLLINYITHHKSLGIKNYILYYNDKLNKLQNDAKSILEYLNNDDQINVTFIEWDYKYWTGIDETWKSYTDINICHCAQITAINDMLYKSKYMFDYVLFSDLDEYLYLEKDINDLLNNNVDVDCFIIYMYWSKYISEHNIDELISITDFTDYFNINNFNKYKTDIPDVREHINRSKIIVKTSNNFINNIHKPYFDISINNKDITLKLNTIYIDGIYQIANLKDKYRKTIIDTYNYYV